MLDELSDDLLRELISLLPETEDFSYDLSEVAALLPDTENTSDTLSELDVLLPEVTKLGGRRC